VTVLITVILALVTDVDDKAALAWQTGRF